MTMLNKLIRCAFMFLLAFTSAPPVFAQQRLEALESLSNDWPGWRGPTLDGHASAAVPPPMHWSRTENVLWSVRIPGRGHGSPTIVNNAIYLPTADRKRDVQSVLCLDRQTGEQKWESIVFSGGLMKKNEKASQASSTIACDGERIYVNFLNDGAVFTTALDLHGERVWQTKISDYVIHQGYGSSPVVYGELVLVSADNKGGGAVAALRRNTGEVVWRRDRPAKPNYPSPMVVRVHGRDQLIMIGCDLVTSLDPNTGEVIWEFEGATTECVTSTVTNGDLIYTSGGYPRNHMSAIRADGSGEVVWENGDRVYVPSMLMKDGFLYAVHDAGVAACYDATTGEVQWKGRLGGNFTASPVLVGNLVFATDERGNTSIYRASPDSFELVARNSLGDDAFATPTIVGGRIFARMGVREDGERNEYLFCIGQEK